MAMRKAQRRKARLRLGISGPAGSGKTLGSLLLAYGICGDWNKICIIDSENNSGDLYANYNKNNISIGEYNIIDLSPPYTPQSYVDAINEAESAGIEVIIVDSLTHAWAGEGGTLDIKGQVEQQGGQNGWSAWRKVTPMHNSLVNAILSSPCHMICTLRAKMEHVQEKDEKGKTIIRKIGMNPIQRDGMEYEFTAFVDVDQTHMATSSKDRTSIMDGRIFSLSVGLGRDLKEWLNGGADSVTCVDCRRDITSTDKNSAPEIVKKTTELTGAARCVKCFVKWGKEKAMEEARVKEEAAENAAQAVSE